jgi:hypothetical protein
VGYIPVNLHLAPNAARVSTFLITTLTRSKTMALPKNVGEQDRTIRLVVATVLIIFSFIVSALSLKILLTVIALVLLFTSATRSCLAYIPLNIDTRKKD